MKKTISIFSLIIILFGTVFSNLSLGKKAFAEETSSYIDVTTISEGGNTVKGSPLITAVPTPGKPVSKVTFYAKAKNEPDVNYYPYAPDSQAPYSWSWSTGAPWVPDGEYTLKMVINYSDGEVETITRDVFAENDPEPNAPESPLDVTASERTTSSVTLTWSASTAQKLYDYVIYQNGVAIDETTSTSFTVNELTAGSTYQFRVKSRDLYNNQSIDDNSITVLVPVDSGNIDETPSISPITANGPAGVTPGSNGYSGTVNLSVNVTDSNREKVDFYVKTYSSEESAYWKFPTVKQSGDNYSINWNSTSAPEGNVIVKAVATDKAGQAKTVTKVILVDNVSDVQTNPDWEPAETPPANRIIGYLAGWSTYNGFDILRDLDASRLTHINYAFALIDTDLKVKMSDGVQDPKNFTALTQLKAKYPHLKTTIAIGGWGGSANFIEAAATEESREIFADSAVDFMLQNGFDGVDLDWEYPVTGGGPGTYPNPADRENYPLLLEKLREKLDVQGAKDGKHYILSIAGGATAGFANNTQLGLSQQYLDYVQIMTYDIHGTWESKADYNAPLLDDNGKTYSVDKGVQAYLNAGVPADKLVMGVPFYGYRYNVTSSEGNGLRQPYSGSGSITYKSLVNQKLLENGYTRFWDEGSKVPYLFNATESVFITYDDPESIGIKAEYIREQGLGGAMIWEISQDHGNDLLKALYDVLKEPIADQQAPVTKPIYEGSNQSAGWYSSDVTVSLSANDNWSGSLTTQYRLNGGEWQTYSAPFNLGEGVHQLEYSSTDAAGNQEETHSETIQIDKTAPESEVRSDGVTLSSGTLLGKAKLTLSTQDALSGVKTLEYRLNGGEWQTYHAPIEQKNDSLVEYRAIDIAGNVEESASLEVRITDVTFNNLYHLVDTASIHHGQHQALKAHIAQAEKAKSKEKTNQKLQKAIEFVDGIQDNHIQNTDRQDIRIFLLHLMK